MICTNKAASDVHKAAAPTIFGGELAVCAKTMQIFNLPCSFKIDPVFVFLFTEVENALQLRSKLLEGDSDYIYAFLDARLVARTSS